MKVNAIRQVDAPQFKYGTQMLPRHGELPKVLFQPTYTTGRTTKRPTITKHQKSFKAIKDELTKTPMLAYFDPKAKHIRQVDGAVKGLGVVLLQKD